MGRWVVCAAWPYVNDKPHLGTFIHLLSADVYSRFLRMRGENVVLVSGSDEHGTAIEVEALKRGVTPYKLASQNHELTKKLLDLMHVDFTNYTRTENKIHIEFVQEFYKHVESNGYVFSQVLKLPYCEFDKRYLPDRFVEGECPFCHYPQARGDQCDNCSRILDPTDLIHPYCVICHTTPVIKESKHWFFDLPRLQKDLVTYVKSNQNLPENARNFSISWLGEGLKPRSLTRDNQWGIPAPFDGAKGKTLYVWMEAVLGYVSATKEWSERKEHGDLWKEYWLDPNSRNIHFIGKDNIPFHTIIFPGLLIASGDRYTLPWQVSSTEFFLFEDQKFSKSRAIGVWMDEALELESSEYWRFAMMSLRPEQKDTNFTWGEFERKVNSELNDVIGNFVHRTTSFIHANFGGRVPGFEPKVDSEALGRIAKFVEKFGRKMESYRLKEALETVVDLARDANKYFNDQEPWRTIKTSRKKASQTLGIAAQYVGAISILIWPFLPESSKAIRNSLGREEDPEWKELKTDIIIREGTEIKPLGPLYHKVSAKDLQTRFEANRRNQTAV